MNREQCNRTGGEWIGNKCKTKSAHDKYKVIFDDGTILEKTRWDIALMSKAGNITENKGGEIHYKGKDFSFTAYPKKEIDSWLDKELEGYISSSMTKEGADKIKEIVKKYNYDKSQAKEVIDDALWYSDEDFFRIHSKKAY